ncbi:hypothetical protein Leryth_020804 [Lithospermum erythrorhizon]|nr:hypothetical protein Leryth_020804 [Lithospermum erythrorhizon]
MTDMMEIEQKDVDLGVKRSQKKSKKRKRVDDIVGILEEKDVKIKELNDEMESLFGFYNEVKMKKDGVFCVEDMLLNGGISLDSSIAIVMEESSLTLSNLVEFVFEKLRGKFGSSENGGGISLASVKSKVILIGQRCYYGLYNADADVLEDDSDCALWCWETRDLKLMPKSTRNLLKIRRTCRKKIHDRIMALSSMIDVLKKSQIHEHCQPDLVKASEKLGKMLSEEDIRKLVESMAQKNDNEMTDKDDAKHGEKISIKQLEKSKREAEKEKKRVTRELLKEKLQSEKELKRLQDEAEKEARRREKEEYEKSKQLKKQQEELEKDQQRKEKEKAELKLQLSLKKQASLMERFLKKAKPASTSLGGQSLQATSTTNADDKFHVSVTQSMDDILTLNDQFDSEHLWRCHLNSWRPLRHSRKLHWSIRQKPKRELVKELKLSTNTETCHDEELNVDRVVDGSVDQSTKSKFCHSNTEVFPRPQKLKRHKQLLQFDKTNRPPFYGFWPTKSQVVKARRPFEKDPDLDYEIDSDEEWEEEEPGESLSDCDKDDEDETLEGGCPRGEDEEESEDGFFVPDGYLSEDEGVEMEKMELDELNEGRNSTASLDTPQCENIVLLLRQQKYLRSMTDHALRKNQPLVILNLAHEKAPLLLAEDLMGVDKIEKMCLQALSMCAFPDSPPIEISVCDNMVEENKEACSTTSDTNILPVATGAAISDSDVPQIVTVVQSNSQGISKIIEALQNKFPNTSKTQLRNKVREIADFCNNRWQVKTDVMVKFGLPTSPEIVRGKNRSVATFFSKRCQPPGKHFNPNETSPQSMKPGSLSQMQHCSTNTEDVSIP